MPSDHEVAVGADTLAYGKIAVTLDDIAQRIEANFEYVSHTSKTL